MCSLRVLSIPVRSLHCLMLMSPRPLTRMVWHVSLHVPFVFVLFIHLNVGFPLRLLTKLGKTGKGVSTFAGVE